jgi:polar amino acid transport system permease protein
MLRIKGQKLQTTDYLLFLTLVSALIYFGYRVQVFMEYEWDWSVIPQYFIRQDQSGHWVSNLLLDGLITTVKLSLWAMVFAILFGTVMGIMRSGNGLFNRLISGSYVQLIRNLPPLVLVFIVYYFFSEQVLSALGIQETILNGPEWVQSTIEFLFVKPVRFTSFLAALLTLALYEGAYITEIVRAGIQSIDEGQWEGAASLGLTPLQQFRLVILPQATQRILPSLAGQLISTIKDSAIVSVISIQELTFQGMELMSATFLTFEVWITVTLMYFMLTFSLSLLLKRLEDKLRIKAV